MHDPGVPQPEWPLELARRIQRLGTAQTVARDGDRVAVWTLLVQVLTRFLRGYARRAGAAGDSGIEDLADEQALELLARAESGSWSVQGRAPGELVRYLERVARNGWLDHVRRSRREASVGMPEDLEPVLRVVPPPADADPERAAIARELASALRGCIEQLPERDRCVWFFRAYYEMSSRDIATHPRVALQPAHVDVINQRARTALRACMRGKGHDLGTVPKGAFVDLWEMLEEMAQGGDARVPTTGEMR